MVSRSPGAPITTGVCHRPLAYRLVTAGFDVCLVSSLTCARYREARYTSWDKNDPKDARVILEVMQHGMTMRYVDPLIAGWHDVQEVAKTYWQVTLARTRVQHSLLTHFLPLNWPEFARFWRTSRSEQFIRMLLAYPIPASITGMDLDTFVEVAWEAAGRKVGKRAWLTGVYETAQHSVALPIALDSPAVTTYRLRLQTFLDLSSQRKQLEAQADMLLANHPDYHAIAREDAVCFTMVSRGLVSCGRPLVEWVRHRVTFAGRAQRTPESLCVPTSHLTADVERCRIE